VLIIFLYFVGVLFYKVYVGLVKGKAKYSLPKPHLLVSLPLKSGLGHNFKQLKKKLILEQRDKDKIVEPKLKISSPIVKEGSNLQTPVFYGKTRTMNNPQLEPKSVQDQSIRFVFDGKLPSGPNSIKTPSAPSRSTNTSYLISRSRDSSHNKLRVFKEQNSKPIYQCEKAFNRIKIKEDALRHKMYLEKLIISQDDSITNELKEDSLKRVAIYKARAMSQPRQREWFEKVITIERHDLRGKLEEVKSTTTSMQGLVDLKYDLSAHGNYGYASFKEYIMYEKPSELSKRYLKTLKEREEDLSLL